MYVVWCGVLLWCGVVWCGISSVFRVCLACGPSFHTACCMYVGGGGLVPKKKYVVARSHSHNPPFQFGSVEEILSFLSDFFR